MTEQLVTYMNQTKQERKKNKREKTSYGVGNKWFGLFPFTIKLLMKKESTKRIIPDKIVK